jgi:MFS family permease
VVTSLLQRPKRPPSAPTSAGSSTVHRAAWLGLAAATGAAALLQLDGTVITVALPTVARELHVSSGTSSAVLTAYFLPYALLLWPGGSLVDRWGSRRTGLAGLAVFAAGVLCGALAPSFGVLVAGRVVQGAGAGLVSPAALAGAVAGFPPTRRGAALGIWGAAAGISNLIGPLLGGLVTAAAGWRAVWWTLLVLGGLAGAAVARLLPRGGGERGAAEGRVFTGTVRSATAVAALTFAVMIGSFFLAEQYLQRTAHYSPLAASAALLLVALLVGLGAPVAGRLADARGERLPALAGFSLAGLGLVVLAVPGMPLHDPATVLPLAAVGLGLGLLFVPTSRAALNATPDALHGRTSALLSGGRLVGAGVGAALAGAAVGTAPTASHVHLALLVAALACLLVGIPAAGRLGSAGSGLQEAEQNAGS